MNLSFTTCCTSNFSPVDTAVIMSECCVLLLVVCNLDCAMVTPLVQLHSWDENTNIGFGAQHQHVRNYMWSWDTYTDHWLEELLVGDLEYLLFWQSAWWNRGLIQHRGRSSQVPCRSCRSSCSSWHAAWIKFCFSFLMILIFSHQNPSLIAGTLASASGPLLDLLNVCCDHNCSMYESWKSASKTAEIWSNNQKTHVHMSLESSKTNGIHVDQLHNEVSFSMG